MRVRSLELSSIDGFLDHNKRCTANWRLHEPPPEIADLARSDSPTRLAFVAASIKRVRYKMCVSCPSLGVDELYCLPAQNIRHGHQPSDPVRHWAAGNASCELYRAAMLVSDRNTREVSMKSILDRSFRYTKSVDTDLRKTFARVRRQQREHVQPQAEDRSSTVLPIRPRGRVTAA
jgi:hypothetical protein